VKRTNHEAPHYMMFPCHLLLSPSKSQISSSAIYSQTHSGTYYTNLGLLFTSVTRPFPGSCRHLGQAI